jgi:Holliday junction DNA helicase RuvA
VTLHTYTNVREDAIQLYGFLSAEERDFFTTLLTISGIGPRMGLNIMSGPSLSNLMEIVESGDVKRLSMIPGVGKKTAARIVLELKEKLVPLSSSPEEEGLDSKIAEDALSALLNLGYTRVQAHDAIKTAWKSCKDMSIEEIIREALKNLAKTA